MFWDRGAYPRDISELRRHRVPGQSREYVKGIDQIKTTLLHVYHGAYYLKDRDSRSHRTSRRMTYRERLCRSAAGRTRESTEGSAGTYMETRCTPSVRVHAKPAPNPHQPATRGHPTDAASTARRGRLRMHTRGYVDRARHRMRAGGGHTCRMKGVSINGPNAQRYRLWHSAGPSPEI